MSLAPFFLLRHGACPRRASIPAVLLAGLLVTACGGGENDAAEPASPPARGTLVSATAAAGHGAAELDALMRGRAGGTQAGAADCGVTLTHIVYDTRDPQGLAATATAGVMVPTGTSALCSGPRPVLLYAHGTTTLKHYDMADTLHNAEALLVEASFAAHGYIVIAPNYLGYDESSMSYHPYLNAEVQAGDMIDGLRAGLAQVAGAGKALASKQLVIAGYSQGGHVAMATHKVLERDHAGEFSVTAAVPMSGPYDLVDFADLVTSPDGAVNNGATLFMPYLLTSYQNAYGNIYTDPAQVYQAPFDKSAPTLFPTDTPVDTLMAEGLMPDDPTFTLLFGTGGLLTDSFRDAYPTSTFRSALQANTLLGWSPEAPVALCGGSSDPTVYFMNSANMRTDFNSRGLNVPLWDLEQRGSLPSGTGDDRVYQDFQAAKLAYGADWPAHYHADLVPPFCYALARGFFADAISTQAAARASAYEAAP